MSEALGNVSAMIEMQYWSRTKLRSALDLCPEF